MVAEYKVKIAEVATNGYGCVLVYSRYSLYAWLLTVLGSLLKLVRMLAKMLGVIPNMKRNAEFTDTHISMYVEKPGDHCNCLLVVQSTLGLYGRLCGRYIRFEKIDC